MQKARIVGHISKAKVVGVVTHSLHVKNKLRRPKQKQYTLSNLQLLTKTQRYGFNTPFRSLLSGILASQEGKV